MKPVHDVCWAKDLIQTMRLFAAAENIIALKQKGDDRYLIVSRVKRYSALRLCFIAVYRISAAARDRARASFEGAFSSFYEVLGGV